MTFRKYIYSFWEGILSLIYPKICIVCNNDFYDGNFPVCNKCKNNIRELPPDIFLKKEQPSNLDSLEIVFLFNDSYQKIIHYLKYKGYKSLGKWIGKLIVERGYLQKYTTQGSVLVPIPLHGIRFRERGYNQAKIIAEGIQSKLDFPIKTDILKRVKNTRSQTNLSKEERVKNMKNAFVLNKESPQYKNVILIDDVFTTGTTMNSAASVFKENTKGKIIGVASAAPRS